MTGRQFLSTTYRIKIVIVYEAAGEDKFQRVQLLSEKPGEVLSNAHQKLALLTAARQSCLQGANQLRIMKTTLPWLLGENLLADFPASASGCVPTGGTFSSVACWVGSLAWIGRPEPPKHVRAR